MICENDCEICGAEGKVRENGLVMCQTCALLAEMEPEDSDFFNSRAEDRDPEGIAPPTERSMSPCQ